MLEDRHGRPEKPEEVGGVTDPSLQVSGLPVPPPQQGLGREVYAPYPPGLLKDAPLAKIADGAKGFQLVDAAVALVKTEPPMATTLSAYTLQMALSAESPGAGLR